MMLCYWLLWYSYSHMYVYVSQVSAVKGAGIKSGFVDENMKKLSES